MDINKKILKKIYSFILMLIIFTPFSVKANIRCNDGTYSSSCNSCHRGCCSHHGGCASSSNTSESSSTSGGVIRTLKNSNDTDFSIKDIIILVIYGCFSSLFGINKKTRKRRR